MKCINCPASAEGYAVIPGIGETGEIRFYCGRCARNHRVRMRYWDGRDLDAKASGDMGDSFQALVFSFQDIARMRSEDLAPVMSWAEDEELALALAGADAGLAAKILSVLPPDRVRRVRGLLESPRNRGTAAASTPESAQELLVSLIRRL